MTITLLYSHSKFPGNWTWVSMFPSVISIIGFENLKKLRCQITDGLSLCSTFTSNKHYPHHMSYIVTLV